MGLFLLLAALVTVPIHGRAFEAWTGLVVSVHDGDTLTVVHGEGPVKVRLRGMDAPELRQPWGLASQAYTASLVLGQVVTVMPRGLDRYRRLLADVVLADGRLVQEESLRVGLSWCYLPSRTFRPTCRQREREARETPSGLWTDPAPIAPWEWRRGRR